MPKHDKNERLDRHSGTGLRGLPKKDGHAGKGGWGKPGTGEDGESILNENDPNYNSDEETDQTQSETSKTTPQTSPVEQIVREYFAYEDFEEIHRSLEKLDRSDLHPQLVKKAIFAAMDKQAYERELVSKLLSGLYGRLLTAQEIRDGFQNALNAAEDVSLDIPDAPNLLARFFARAVADEIVPPIFFAEANAPSPQARQALDMANALATENHSGKRLEYIWGPGNLKSVKRLKEEGRTILEEYLVNNDKKEAETSLRNLNAPSFHFQVVKIALRLMLEKGTSGKDKIVLKLSELLKYFLQVALLTEDQMRQGFKVVQDTLADIKLDVPQAESTLNEIIETAQHDGWLRNVETAQKS